MSSKTKSQAHREEGNEFYRQAHNNGLPPVLQRERLKKAMVLYNQALDTSMNSMEKSSALKNIGLTSMKLFTTVHQLREHTSLVDFYLKEGIKNIDAALDFGKSGGQTEAWINGLYERFMEFINSVFRHLNCTKKSKERCHILEDIAITTINKKAKSRLLRQTARIYFNCSVIALEAGDFKSCLSLLGNCHRPLEEAKLCISETRSSNDNSESGFKEEEHQSKTHEDEGRDNKKDILSNSEDCNIGVKKEERIDKTKESLKDESVEKMDEEKDCECDRKDTQNQSMDDNTEQESASDINNKRKNTSSTMVSDDPEIKEFEQESKKYKQQKENEDNINDDSDSEESDDDDDEDAIDIDDDNEDDDNNNDDEDYDDDDDDEDADSEDDNNTDNTSEDDYWPSAEVTDAEDILDLESSVFQQQCRAESLQARESGDSLLKKSIKDSEDLNMDAIFIVIDFYKKAILLTKEVEVEMEAIALSRLGNLYDSILKDEVRAKQNFMRSLQLAGSLQPRSFHREEWYKIAAIASERYQRAFAEKEEKEREKERAPYLKELKNELEEIKKHEEKGAVPLLKFIYKTWPPKGKDKELMELTTDPQDQKKALKKAIVHFHPDKQDVKLHGMKWFVLAEEITKILTRKYEYFKG